MLSVSPATAHRAMDLLVQRRLLVRHQGRGTFVGDAIGRPLAAHIRTIYVLLTDEGENVSSFDLDALINAVRGRIGGTNVQFTFLPREGSVEYIRELIGSAQSSGQFAGAIPISCSREVYRYLAQAGAPMVVLGSLYVDQQHIAAVDIDYKQAGWLLAHHLLGRGHKRMALLTTGEGRPGDHAFFDGVSNALTEAGLPHNALAVRIFPRDFETFRAQVREVLDRPDRPTGIICHSERMVGAVLATAEQLGLSVPRDVELAFQGQARSSDEHRFARVEPKLGFDKISQVIADMLRQVMQGKRPEQERIVVPVELREPGQG